MNQINFYLQNQKINPPQNWRELGIEANFVDGEFKSQQATINNWNFVNYNIDVINAWIGGGRIFEGLPFRIEEVQEVNGNIITLFDGYIDLTDETIYDEYSIQAKSKELYSLDWINDRASAVSFEYLYAQEVITQSDFVDIPYVISSIPNYRDSAIALVSLTFCSITTYNEGKAIIATVAALISDPLSYGQLFALVVQLLKFIALIIAVTLLIKQMFELLIQRVKYHKGAKINQLLTKVFGYFGLNYIPSIISDDLYILPKKYVIPKNNTSPYGLNILGAFQPNEFVQFGYPKENVADFIIKLKDTFNAKIVIDPTAQTATICRRDISTQPATYNLPPIYNTTYKLNINDINSNFLIEFQTDVSEDNTITQYQGTLYQIIQRPTNNPPTQELNMMKGFRQINIPFALGKRKTELTPVEKIFDELLDALDILVHPIVNAINATIPLVNDLSDIIGEFIELLEDVINFFPGVEFEFPEIPHINLIEYNPISQLIDNRIGMLLLEKDYFSIDKLLSLGSDYKLNETQPTAKYLYENCYVIEMENNQFKFKDYNNVPFTSDNYLQVKNNPNGIDEDGNPMKIESLTYNPFDKTATMKLKIPYIYANNLELKFNEPTGE